MYEAFRLRNGLGQVEWPPVSLIPRGGETKGLKFEGIESMQVRDAKHDCLMCDRF